MKSFITLLVIIILIAVGWMMFTDTEVVEENGEVNDEEELVNDEDEVVNDEDEMVNDDEEVVNDDEEEEAEQETVSFTDEGFEPAELTVPAGTTVVFENNSDQDMWVASNPHPAHTDLPGFDQEAAGDSYEYTFEESGEWGYHNHLAPNHTGTVIVE